MSDTAIILATDKAVMLRYPGRLATGIRCTCTLRWQPDHPIEDVVDWALFRGLDVVSVFRTVDGDLVRIDFTD